MSGQIRSKYTSYRQTCGAVVLSPFPHLPSLSHPLFSTSCNFIFRSHIHASVPSSPLPIRPLPPNHSPPPPHHLLPSLHTSILATSHQTSVVTGGCVKACHAPASEGPVAQHRCEASVKSPRPGLVSPGQLCSSALSLTSRSNSSCISKGKAVFCFWGCKNSIVLTALGEPEGG